MIPYMISSLPKTIRAFYDRMGANSDNVEAVVSTLEDNVNVIEIQYFNQTVDVWAWDINPESKDPRFPRTWIFRGNEKLDVPDETNKQMRIDGKFADLLVRTC